MTRCATADSAACCRLAGPCSICSSAGSAPASAAASPSVGACAAALQAVIAVNLRWLPLVQACKCWCMPRSMSFPVSCCLSRSGTGNHSRCRVWSATTQHSGATSVVGQQEACWNHLVMAVAAKKAAGMDSGGQAVGLFSRATRHRREFGVLNTCAAGGKPASLQAALAARAPSSRRAAGRAQRRAN